MRNIVLLCFSLFFYACGGLNTFPLLIVSTLINYVAGLLVTSKHGKVYLVIALLMNLILLCYYKYTGFIVTNINLIGFDIPVPEIALPIGISFFTFQGMSYIIDVYQKKVTASKNILHIALYMALFPKLISGPIVRYGDIADELRTRHETIDDFAAGCIRLCFGLAKKLLLAQPLGEITDAVFAMQSPTAGLAWIGAIAYTGQIYLDFSAYSDMALGIGRMFGFHFLENFNYPYIAQSISEFWHRWHISLSTWFRDYIYFPLGGNRKGRARQVLNILVVWTLTGLWHGAAWSFILWGFYFGILLLAEKFIWEKPLKAAPRAVRHIYMMFFVIIGRVLFRGETTEVIFNMFSAMFSGPLWDNQTTYYLRQYGFIMIISFFACLPIKPALEKWLTERDTKFSRFVLTFAPPALALLMLLLSLSQIIGSTTSSFIYFRF